MKISRRHSRALLVSAVILLLSLSVLAQDNEIVPGKSVGRVRLGDTRDAVFMTLGKPSETKRWRSGLVKDSWVGPEKPSGSAGSQIFFHVLYRAGRVVQIEFNDPKYKTAAGVSIDSTLAQFRRSHPRPSVRALTYDDGEGSGFVGYYYDDVRGGIAFSFGTQDYFDSTTIPEALRVHVAGQLVIPDPGGKPTKANDERPVEKPKSEHGNKPDAQGRNSAELEGVIREFWNDLGRLDADGLKRLLDWPVMIVEASDRGNKQSVLGHPQDVDEAFKRTPESALKKGRSEFYGTRLSAFNVQMLNSNLASVAYVCQLPRDLVAAGPVSNRARFNALTLLQRDTNHSHRWSIILITVPK